MSIKSSIASTSLGAKIALSRSSIKTQPGVKVIVNLLLCLALNEFSVVFTTDKLIIKKLQEIISIQQPSAGFVKIRDTDYI